MNIVPMENRIVAKFIASAVLAMVVHIAPTAAQIDNSQTGDLRAGDSPQMSLTPEAQNAIPQDTAPQLPAYGGSICDRAYLTGDCCGRRTALAMQGITFTGDITSYFQGVVNGGRERHFKFGAHADYILDLDMDKVAGAEGMFIRVRGESQCRS